ncbi:MAG: hypothetical protein IT256_03620 [Chitinophagaceae bacterium]|nr:hypothetical protein [Chitinophagaceae bacterium]
MWAWFKKSWLFLALYIAILPFLLVSHFGKKWLNREIEVKRINPETVSKKGDIRFDEISIDVHFFWTIRKFLWSDITELNGFSEEENREEYRKIAVCRFYRGVSIFFNVESEENLKFIDALKSKLNIGFINWNTELENRSRDRPYIFYKKK